MNVTELIEQLKVMPGHLRVVVNLSEKLGSFVFGVEYGKVLFTQESAARIIVSDYLSEEVSELESEVKRLEAELEELDGTIDDNEQEISDLNKEIRELKKGAKNEST